MTNDRREPGVTAEEVERDGERLLEVLADCDQDDPFPVRVETSLRAALAILSQEPALIRLLRVDPLLEQSLPSVVAQRSWLGRYAELLRISAMEALAPKHSPASLESSLIRGICWTIAKRVRAGQSESLPGMLPELHAYLLAYYPAPDEGLGTGPAR
jgi:hypothetical protein